MKILLLLLLLTARVVAATYYVDYASGNDANAGTSKTAPWKHHPAMAPFSGTYTHAAGDRIIFKGGVTWPVAALPMRITHAGTSASPNYHGVDLSWFTGSSWSRPVLDAGGTAFTNHGGNLGNVVFIYRASYNEIDNLDIRGMRWNNVGGSATTDCWGIAVDGAVATVRNCYVHDWVVAYSLDNKHGGVNGFNGASVSAYDTTVKGPESDAIPAAYISDSNKGLGWTAGTGFMGLALLDGCEVSLTTQGLFACNIIANSYIHDTGNSYDAATHENGIWLQNTGTLYNSVLANTREGVHMYVLPGWGSRTDRTTSVFNCVFYNMVYVGGGVKIVLSNQDVPVGSNSRIHFFNNIVQNSGSCVSIGTTKVGAPLSELRIQNNLWISDGTAVADNDTSEDDYTTLIDSGNVTMTLAEAAAANLTQAAFFQPTSTVAVIKDQGTDLSAVSLTQYTLTAPYSDKLGVARESAAWDVGAYEYVAGGGGTPPAAPSSVSATDGEPETVTLTWSPVSGATSYAVFRHTSDDSGASSSITTGVTTTSYEDTPPAEDTTYFYWIKAANTYGTSGFSPSDSGFASSGVPADPSTLAATATGTATINLTWDDNADNEISYVVERSLVTGEGFEVIATLPADTEAYSDSGLDADTTYYYRVVARNGSGDSGYSAEASDTTDASQPVNDVDTLVDVVTGGALSAGDVASWTIDGSAIYQSTQQTVPANAARASYLFNVTEAGDYWVVCDVTASLSSTNSFFIEIDGEPAVNADEWDIVELTFGSEQRLASQRGNGTFAVPQYDPKVWTLAEGTHEVLILGREANTTLHSIELRGVTAGVSAPPVAVIAPVSPVPSGPTSGPGAATLDASGSTDDEEVVSYRWSAADGPTEPELDDPTAAICEVTGMIPGTYEFQVTVADADEQTHATSVIVTVYGPPAIPGNPHTE